MAPPETAALVSTEGGTDEAGTMGEEDRGQVEDLIISGPSGSKIEEVEGGNGIGSPFNELPDELIAYILQLSNPFFFNLEDELPSYFVNKRFYNIAMSIVLNTITSLKPTETIVRRPELHRVIRRLDYTGSGIRREGFFPDLTRLLRTFKNITSVSLEGDFQGDPDILAGREFTDALRQLPLKKLAIRLIPSLIFEDTSFSIGKDLPQLEELAIDQCEGVAQLLTGPNALRSLTVRSYYGEHNFWPFIPWQSLRSLTVLPGYGTTAGSTIGELEKSLRKALGGTGSDDSLQDDSPPTLLPLRRFELGAPLFTTPLKVNNNIFRHGSILLHTLSYTTPLSLSLYLHSPLKIPHYLPPFPSVELLHLETREVDASLPLEMLRLRQIISLFPSVKHFRLTNLPFIVTGIDTSLSCEVDSAEFCFSHPMLFAFLASIQRSSILRFDWTHWRHALNYSWTRKNIADEFEVERYQVY
ncbi:hypothetical protein JCM8547_002950 [Rhodosporidiobolus lusitaniae]